MTWPDDYLIPGIEPFHVEEAGIIYLGKQEELLPRITGEIDLVFTSPPYNLGEPTKGSMFGKHTMGKKLEYIEHKDAINEDDYIKQQHNMIKECYRIIGSGGAIFYNHKPRIQNGILDDRKNLIPFPIRQEIIWDRCCGFNYNGSFYVNSTERIYIIAKNGWKPIREYVSLGEVWRVPIDQSNPHPAPFPLALAKRVIESASPLSAICLDPYFGSGTLGVAAKDLGRRFIGIEMSQAYAELAVKRLRQGVLNFGIGS